MKGMSEKVTPAMLLAILLSIALGFLAGRFSVPPQPVDSVIAGEWNAQQIVAAASIADKFVDRIISAYDQYSDGELAVRLERAQPFEQIAMMVYLNLKRKGGANFVPVLARLHEKNHLENSGARHQVAELASYMLTLNDAPRESPALLGPNPPPKSK